MQAGAVPEQATKLAYLSARTPRAGSNRWRERVLGIGVTVGLAICVLLVARRLDLAAFGTALRHASFALVFAAAALSILSQWTKAFLWRVMLDAPPSVTTGRLLRYAAATLTLSMVTPLRAGEALRPWLLWRRHAVPLGHSTGVALAEKLMDVLSLAMLVLPLPWLVPTLSHGITRAVALLTVSGAVVLGVSVFAARRLSPRGRMGRLLGGVRVLKERGTFARAFGVAVVVWALDLAALWTALRAVGVHEGYAGAALVLLGVNAALFIPATPGNLGTLEAGAVVALGLLGVPRPVATAGALLYHAVQLVPLLAVAALDIPTTLSLFRANRRAPAD
jgi:uncharacterized membrane protein YbhN (UPF0104 family)